MKILQKILQKFIQVSSLELLQVFLQFIQELFQKLLQELTQKILRDLPGNRPGISPRIPSSIHVGIPLRFFSWMLSVIFARFVLGFFPRVWSGIATNKSYGITSWIYPEISSGVLLDDFQKFQYDFFLVRNASRYIFINSFRNFPRTLFKSSTWNFPYSLKSSCNFSKSPNRFSFRHFFKNISIHSFKNCTRYPSGISPRISLDIAKWISSETPLRIST